MNRSERHGVKSQSDHDVSERLEVRLSPIPERSDTSTSGYRQFIRKMCKNIATEAREEREGKAPLGVRRAERMHPHFKPESIAHSPAPLIHCTEAEARHSFKRAYKSFVDAFKEACEGLLNLHWEDKFPEGGLLPLWEIRPILP